MAKKGKTTCYHRGCTKKVEGAPGPRVCRDHAADRIAELKEELKTLRSYETAKAE